MKNLKKYSKKTYDKFVLDYVTTSISYRILARTYGIPESTTYNWIKGIRRNVKKPCSTEVKVIESLICGNKIPGYIDSNDIDLKLLFEKYFGKNENNFAGLKSKV